MRYGDEGAADIGQLKHDLEERQVILRLDADRHDHSVDSILLEPW
jgi:hypothetical protein